MTGRRLILILFLAFGLSMQAQAASTPVIIQISPNASIGLITNILNATLLDSIPGANTYLLNVPLVQTLLGPLQPVLTPLLSLVGVQWLEVNTGITQPGLAQLGVFQAVSSAAPDWYKYQPSWEHIHALEGLAYATGRGVVVADLNSQIDYSHPALRGHLTGGYDFVANRPAGGAVLNQSEAGFMDQSEAGFMDQSEAGFMDQFSLGFLSITGLPLASSNPAYSHGTLCAGVIAAIAPDSMIMPLRVFDDQGQTDLFSIAKAIQYAVQNGAQVINMSFGTMTNSNAIKNAIANAKSHNVFLAASAGNNNTSAPQYPAAYSGVITTAATDINDTKGSFSNYGPSVVVDAPGVNIILPYPGGMYSVVSGTSFSAPAVAGAAALIRSVYGNTGSITGTAVNINFENPSYVNQLGYGRIDVLGAVKPN